MGELNWEMGICWDPNVYPNVYVCPNENNWNSEGISSCVGSNVPGGFPLCTRRTKRNMFSSNDLFKRQQASSTRDQSSVALAIRPAWHMWPLTKEGPEAHVVLLQNAIETTNARGSHGQGRRVALLSSIPFRFRGVHAHPGRRGVCRPNEQGAAKKTGRLRMIRREVCQARTDVATTICSCDSLAAGSDDRTPIALHHGGNGNWMGILNYERRINCKSFLLALRMERVEN